MKMRSTLISMIRKNYGNDEVLSSLKPFRRPEIALCDPSYPQWNHAMSLGQSGRTAASHGIPNSSYDLLQ